MEEKKFTDEEMSTINKIKDDYTDVQIELGQLAVARLRLTQQLEGLDKAEDNLTKRFKEVQDREATFLKEVTKKYGEGTLNPETGIFNPSS